MKRYIWLICGLLLVLSACSDFIEYSPYDIKTDDEAYNINEISKIGSLSLQPDTFKFIVFSDVHEWYDDLADAVESINRQNNIQFVVCCGDVSNSGLSQEYQWYIKAIKKLQVPIITVIGNHDYLSNGSLIFEKVFGSLNTSFVAGNYRFVFFDNDIWESHISPRYDWLHQELNDSIHKQILFAHIPPWSDQMEGMHNLIYNQIVSAHDVKLCFYGHEHDYKDTVYQKVRTIVSGAINRRCYWIVSLVDDTCLIKRYKF